LKMRCARCRNQRTHAPPPPLPSSRKGPLLCPCKVIVPQAGRLYRYSI
jgi:hypothetical protein